MTALLSLWRTLTGEEQTGLILVLLVWAVLWLLVWRDFVRDVHTFVRWTLGWGRGVKIRVIPFERPASGEAWTGRAGVSAARSSSAPPKASTPFERSPVEGVHSARATVGSAPTDPDAGARSARSFPSPAAKGFAAQRVGRIR